MFSIDFQHGHIDLLQADWSLAQDFNAGRVQPGSMQKVVADSFANFRDNSHYAWVPAVLAILISAMRGSRCNLSSNSKDI